MTGRLLAYNQLIKHDPHDWDVEAPPTLGTTRGGKRIIPLSRDTLTRFCPGITGGVEWNGAAYGPGTDLLYIGAVDRCVSARLRKGTVAVPQTGWRWMGEIAGNASSIPPVRREDGSRPSMPDRGARAGNVRSPTWPVGAPQSRIIVYAVGE